MVAADYLRHQANICLRFARDCFDLSTAARLRLMAAELHAVADESDRRDGLANTLHNGGLPRDDASPGGIKKYG